MVRLSYDSSNIVHKLLLIPLIDLRVLSVTNNPRYIALSILQKNNINTIIRNYLT